MPALSPWLLLAVAPALATGLPPSPTVVIRAADCQEVAAAIAPAGSVRITYDLVTGSCAPGGPCSTWVAESLDASALVVKLSGCDEPLPGRFTVVPDATCEDRPLWQWSGVLYPGRHHLIGVDGGGGLMLLQATGTPADAGWCPPESPSTPLPPTPIERTGLADYRVFRFGPEHFSLEDTPEGTRIVWRPTAALASWGYEALSSAPLPRAQAEAALAQAPQDSSGWQVQESRYHYEGTQKRGIISCELVYEHDVVLTLPGSKIPLQGTAHLRSQAEPTRCTPTP